MAAFQNGREQRGRAASASRSRCTGTSKTNSSPNSPREKVWFDHRAMWHAEGRRAGEPGRPIRILFPHYQRSSRTISAYCQLAVAFGLRPRGVADTRRLGRRTGCGPPHGLRGPTAAGVSGASRSARPWSGHRARRRRGSTRGHDGGGRGTPGCGRAAALTRARAHQRPLNRTRPFKYCPNPPACRIVLWVPPKELAQKGVEGPRAALSTFSLKWALKLAPCICLSKIGVDQSIYVAGLL